MDDKRSRILVRALDRGAGVESIMRLSVRYRINVSVYSTTPSPLMILRAPFTASAINGGAHTKSDISGSPGRDNYRKNYNN